MSDDIRKILEAGAQAPSGSNSQPWKFRVSENQIEIFAFPEKDHPVLNFKNRGTWVAHGALIENILIASSNFGYEAKIDLFPAGGPLARITLQKSTPKNEPLYPFIPLRATNRKPYKTTPLDSEQKSRLTEVPEDIKGVEVKLFDDKEKIKLLSEASSVNEIVMFENQILHNLLFEEIVWSEKEEKKKKTGLYLKTMELKPPQQIALRIFKYWPVMNFLNNKFGLAKQIAKDNAKNYALSSALGAIILNNIDGNDERLALSNAEGFVNIGRVMQKIWLEATKMGLSFHLLTGISFLWQRIGAGETKEFSQEHIDLIKDAYQKIASVCGLRDDPFSKNKIVALMFRVGYADPPSYKSSKLSLGELIIKE